MSFERDGFLSEQIRHRFSNGEPECQQWFSLARRFNSTVHATISTPRDINIEKAWDAKALVHLLYFRAVSNFQGAVLLADRGLIVESRGLLSQPVRDLLGSERLLREQLQHPNA